MRRRGKKFCCKKGIHAHLDKSKGSCDQPDREKVIDKALEIFKLKQDLCTEIYSACCQDDIVGEEM
jgi:hypothetical protein